MHIHSTGKKNHLVFSPGTLLCGCGICYFIPTCWYNISSLNRHQALKSSGEHCCCADCFPALHCAVIVRWIARLAQAHSVCVRNREGDFPPASPTSSFLPVPLLPIKVRYLFMSFLVEIQRAESLTQTQRETAVSFCPPPAR